MANAKASADIFTNFYYVKVTLDGTDSTTMAENDFDTGLSSRGGLGWVIHRIEVWPTFKAIRMDADLVLKVALSTKKDEGSLPDPDVTGVIFHNRYAVSAAAAGTIIAPHEPHYMVFDPPLLIASKNLSMYAETEVDDAAWRNTTVHARIHYTYWPVGIAEYLEIAETWGAAQ